MLNLSCYCTNEVVKLLTSSMVIGKYIISFTYGAQYPRYNSRQGGVKAFY